MQVAFALVNNGLYLVASALSFLIASDKDADRSFSLLASAAAAAAGISISQPRGLSSRHDAARACVVAQVKKKKKTGKTEKKRTKFISQSSVRPPSRPLTFMERSSGMLMSDTCPRAPRRRLLVACSRERLHDDSKL